MSTLLIIYLIGIGISAIIGIAFARKESREMSLCFDVHDKAFIAVQYVLVAPLAWPAFALLGTLYLIGRLIIVRADDNEI